MTVVAVVVFFLSCVFFLVDWEGGVRNQVMASFAPPHHFFFSHPLLIYLSCQPRNSFASSHRVMKVFAINSATPPPLATPLPPSKSSLDCKGGGKIALLVVMKHIHNNHHGGFHIIMRNNYSVCQGANIKKKTVLRGWSQPNS